MENPVRAEQMENPRRAAQIIQPGPILDDVLHSQNIHRSQYVWQNEDNAKNLRCQVSTNSSLYERIDDRVLHYVRRAGFEGVVKIGGINVDYSLITALVERWRPETHTFHLTVGEATITLQDVEVMTGLSVDGNPITGSANYDWDATCEVLLGVVPPADAKKGNAIKFSWLEHEFQNLEPNANDDIVQWHARGFLLRVLGGLLFGSKSSGLVNLIYLPLLHDFDQAGQYAWGAATLAHLYREMCKATKLDVVQIGGCLQLLQVWAYERIPKIAPLAADRVLMDKPYSFRWKSPEMSYQSISHDLKAFRIALDEQQDDEFVWQPYINVLDKLPQYCVAGKRVWCSVAPLLCFHIVEYHHPDRCLRQFGMDQHIPGKSLVLEYLHKVEFRNNVGEDWEERHGPFVDKWNDRYNLVASNVPLRVPLGPQSEYMQWYVMHTRRWISPTGATKTALRDGLQALYHLPEEQISREVIRERSTSLIGALNQEHYLADTYVPQNAPLPPSFLIMQEPANEARRAKRRRRRDRVEPIHDLPLPIGVQQIAPPMLFPMYKQFDCEQAHQNEPHIQNDRSSNSSTQYGDEGVQMG